MDRLFDVPGTDLLKVLTVRQPWASLIVSGMKSIENRNWTTSFRGRLLIHAGKTIEQTEWNEMFDALPTGAILGSVDVVDVVRDSTSEWAEADSFHWILANAIEFDSSIPATGKLGLWNVTDPETLDAISREIDYSVELTAAEA